MYYSGVYKITIYIKIYRWYPILYACPLNIGDLYISTDGFKAGSLAQRIVQQMKYNPYGHMDMNCQCCGPFNHLDHQKEEFHLLWGFSFSTAPQR